MQERKLAELNVLAHFLLFCRSGSTLDEKKAGERKGDPFGHLSDLQRTAMPTVRGFVGFSSVKNWYDTYIEWLHPWCDTIGIFPPPI